MLSLRKSCYHIKAVHRFVGATRCSSVLKKSEIVVSEVKHLASVAIKLYDSHDLDQQMKLLCELRSADASGREEVVSVFSKKYPRIASTWLADWVCKSAVGGNTAKLFPVIIPVDDVNLSLDVKSDLADAVYAIKMSNKGTGVVENESVMRTQAMKLADELGDSIHIDRLRKVGSVFQDFVDAPIPIASFLDELVCESGLFANKLQPLLEFTELPVPQKIHDQMLESENDRQHIHARLVDELTYVTHVVNSSRFNAEAQTAEVQTQVSAVELIKGLSEAPSADYKDRFPEKEHLRRSVIIGNAADFAGFEPSSLLQISDTGLVHTRRAIDSRRKLRFSADIFLFNVKAPCYRVGHGLQGAARRDAATSSLNFDHGLLVKSMDAALADPADLPDIHVHPPAVDDQALHESMPNRKIMIDNLPRDITEGGLRDALRKCGNIEKVWIFKDERATPEEVKYMNALRLRQPRTSGTFVDLSNTEGPFNLQLEGTMLLPSADRGEGEDEARSRAAAVAGELDSELMEDAGKHRILYFH